MASYCVGIEIGMNRATMGVVDGQGTLLCRRVFGATSVNNAERFTDTLCDHLEDMLLKRGLMPADVRRIGIAVAGGSLMAREGDICAQEVFGAQPVPLRALVEGRVGVNPAVYGDAHAAAIAQLWHTRTQGDFLCVTLGRGVGLALVRGGSLQAGGIVAVCDAGRPADADTLPQPLAAAMAEAIGSHAVAHKARLLFPHKLPAERLSARDVFALAEQGDADANALLLECIAAFAAALLPVCGHYGIQDVVLAGALCAYQPSLAEPLNTRLAALAHAAGQAQAPVTRVAVCGGDSALVGAALGLESLRG